MKGWGFILVLWGSVLFGGCQHSLRQQADRTLYEADSLYRAGLLLQPDTLLDNAIAYYHDRLFRPKDKLAKAYFYRGRFYQKKKCYSKAITDLLAAENCYDRRTDNTIKAHTYANIGYMCEMELHHDSLAGAYYRQAEHCFWLAGDTVSTLYLQAQQARIAIQAGQLQEALSCLLHIYPMITDSAQLLFVSNLLGITYYKRSDTDSAMYCFRKILAEKTRCFEYASACNYIAQFYCNADQLDSAARYANLSLQTSAAYNISNYYILHEYAAQQQNVALMATYMHSRADAQSAYTKEKSELTMAVSLIEQAQAVKKKQNKQLLMYIASLILLLCCVSFISWKYIKSRNKSQLLHQEKQQKERLRETREQRQQQRNQNILTARENYIHTLKQAIDKACEKPGLTDIQKDIIRLDIYDKRLHLQDFSRFKRTMDRHLNGLASHLHACQTKTSTYTGAQIKICCLLLLDISEEDMRKLLRYKNAESFRSACNYIKKKYQVLSLFELRKYLLELMQNNNYIK